MLGILRPRVNPGTAFIGMSVRPSQQIARRAVGRGAGPAAGFEQSRDYVQSLARGLNVLRSIAGDRATLADIAARSGLSRAAARRLVLTLEHLGYVQSAGRDYRLTPRVLELGFGFLGAQDLTDLAQPWMERLAHEAHESCSMAVLDGRDIVYVARVSVRKVMTVSLAVGARLPAYCTSMGRVLLAGLPPAQFEAWLTGLEARRYTRRTVIEPARLRRIVEAVRRDGYVWVEQELETGLCSLAVPLRNRAGHVVAALNLGMPFHADAHRRAMNELLPALRRTALSIERCMPATWLAPVGA
jgi:IclR family transcriptional regulator, pca regulon regulatory protein